MLIRLGRGQAQNLDRMNEKFHFTNSQFEVLFRLEGGQALNLDDEIALVPS